MSAPGGVCLAGFIPFALEAMQVTDVCGLIL